MEIPIISIVGRPNVGKSSLLNCLTGRFISIVEDTPGVTRDRISALMEEDDFTLQLVDTGGIGNTDSQGLSTDVDYQIEQGLAQSDGLIFLVDIKEGLSPMDEVIARKLRKTSKPVLFVANKTDHPNLESKSVEFAKLGLGDPKLISAKENIGRADLIESLKEAFPEGLAERSTTDGLMKLALVGKRNAGKSTLLNRLAREDRVIVSDLPGTTRDSVDVEVKFKGKTFIAIDTAGMRKKGRIEDSVEFFSLSRTDRSIKRCHVALLMIDATSEISIVDKQIAEKLADNHKPTVIVINKWDLAKNKTTTGDYEAYIRDRLHPLSFAPIAFISAKDSTNLARTIKLAQELYRQSGTRMTTGQVNKVLEAAVTLKNPPIKGGKKVNILYAHQIDVNPPTILIYCNAPDAVGKEYKRFMESYFRKHLPFSEVPLQVLWKGRSSS